jgi:formate hydrogenlyase subunit 3/multisubunit Na+/H+ antiporter MnhD subunit
VAVLAIAVGGLSLAGFPLTGGFTARWLVIQELPVGFQRWALLLLAAGAAVSIGYLRGLSLAVDRAESENISQTPLIVNVVILLFLAANVLLALYPQLFLNPIIQVMAAWSIPR